MDSDLLPYHRRVAEQKRAAILEAASALFARDGYGGTSLARVAAAAAVSTATLFKQFPTKDDLFEAIVVAFWSNAAGVELPPSSIDPKASLRALGRQYAALLMQPGMAGLHRMVIAEAPRFPELARIQFDLGKEPFFAKVAGFLDRANAEGTMNVTDAVAAATQFLGMISNFVLWPKMLLVEWETSDEEASRIVENAVDTILARYGATS